MSTEHRVASGVKSPAALTRPSVLLVEDDSALAASLKQGLADDGYDVEIAGRSSIGFARALTGDFFVVVIDVGLPDGCGIELTRMLRAQGIDGPLLLLTSYGDSETMVAGLDAGADDYVVKPVSLDVLGARVRALGRRLQRPSPLIRVGDLVLEPACLRARRNGTDIDLTPAQARLLEALMRHAGNVLSRAQLGRQVHNGPDELLSNVVDVHVRALRAKIDTPFGTDSIETVRGLGYRLRRPSLAP